MPSRSFLATIEFSSMEVLSPRTSPGLAEVPSLGAITGVAPLLPALLDVALDFAAFFLASGGGMALFPFKPLLLGEMSGTFSLARFFPMTTPLAAGVEALEPLAI